MKKNILLLPLVCVLLAFASKGKIPVCDIPYIEKNLCLVPGQTFVMAPSDQDLPYVPVRKSMVVTVPEFYMFNQEVSNRFYLLYTQDIKTKGDSTLYKTVLPDTLVWRTKNAYNEPYVDYYFRHPAYAQYPVVGVSYDQCLMFCEWLTKRYNNYQKRKFKKVIFTLPDSAQREVAARGGLDIAPFPWAGPYLQNSKGQWLANFKVISQAGIARMDFDVKDVYGNTVKQQYLVASNYQYLGVAGMLNDAADITAPVLSYEPNKYGLYNMAGNVEEFILGKGLTMGGSWQDPGYYLQNHVFESYDVNNSASSERGFRFVMKVIEK